MSPELELERYLDDLLVANNVLPSRKIRSFTEQKPSMKMLVPIAQGPRVKIKVEVYPNETEEPHFKVTYQNTTCRFRISDCEPMKAELQNGVPVQIQKIMKYIKQMWRDNKDLIIKAWQNSRPSNQNHGHQSIR